MNDDNEAGLLGRPQVQIINTGQKDTESLKRRFDRKIRRIIILIVFVFVALLGCIGFFAIKSGMFRQEELQLQIAKVQSKVCESSAQ